MLLRGVQGPAPAAISPSMGGKRERPGGRRWRGASSTKQRHALLLGNCTACLAQGWPQRGVVCRRTCVGTVMLPGAH
jgi:hypothetical protein